MTLMRLKPPTSGVQVDPGGSAPTTGYQITKLHYDSGTLKIAGEYDDAGDSAGFIPSTAPTGKFPITNIYFDPSTGQMMGEYDDGG